MIEYDDIGGITNMFCLLEAAAKQQYYPSEPEVLYSFGEDGGPYPRRAPETAGVSIRRSLVSAPPPAPLEGHLQRLAGLPSLYRFAAVALLDLLPARMAASPTVERAREALRVSGPQEKVMKDYLAATREAERTGYQDPDLMSLLSDAALALQEAKVPPGTPLFYPDAVRREDTGGREQVARVIIPVPQPLDRVAWIVDPRFWPRCIGQVEKVEFPGGMPHGKTYKTWIRETINLARPVEIGKGLLVSDLDVTLDYRPGERATLSYSLRPGGSKRLDVDEGKIEVHVPEGSRGDVTLVEIVKRVVLKPDPLLEEIFHLNPDGLDEMLRFWVLQSYKYCQIEGTVGF
jgi:hypothetical protein